MADSQPKISGYGIIADLGLFNTELKKLWYSELNLDPYDLNKTLTRLNNEIIQIENTAQIFRRQNDPQAARAAAEAVYAGRKAIDALSYYISTLEGWTSGKLARRKAVNEIKNSWSIIADAVNRLKEHAEEVISVKEPERLITEDWLESINNIGHLKIDELVSSLDKFSKDLGLIHAKGISKFEDSYLQNVTRAIGELYSAFAGLNQECSKFYPELTRSTLSPIEEDILSAYQVLNNFLKSGRTRGEIKTANTHIKTILKELQYHINQLSTRRREKLPLAEAREYQETAPQARQRRRGKAEEEILPTVPMPALRNPGLIRAANAAKEIADRAANGISENSIDTVKRDLAEFLRNIQRDAERRIPEEAKDKLQRIVELGARVLSRLDERMTPKGRANLVRYWVYNSVYPLLIEIDNFLARGRGAAEPSMPEVQRTVPRGQGRRITLEDPGESIEIGSRAAAEPEDIAMPEINIRGRRGKYLVTSENQRYLLIAPLVQLLQGAADRAKKLKSENSSEQDKRYFNSCAARIDEILQETEDGRSSTLQTINKNLRAANKALLNITNAIENESKAGIFARIKKSRFSSIMDTSAFTLNSAWNRIKSTAGQTKKILVDSPQASASINAERRAPQVELRDLQAVKSEAERLIRLFTEIKRRISEEGVLNRLPELLQRNRTLWQNTLTQLQSNAQLQELANKISNLVRQLDLISRLVSGNRENLERALELSIRTANEIIQIIDRIEAEPIFEESAPRPTPVPEVRSEPAHPATIEENDYLNLEYGLIESVRGQTVVNKQELINALEELITWQQKFTAKDFGALENAELDATLLQLAAFHNLLNYITNNTQELIKNITARIQASISGIHQAISDVRNTTPEYRNANQQARKRTLRQEATTLRQLRTELVRLTENFFPIQKGTPYAARPSQPERPTPEAEPVPQPARPEFLRITPAEQASPEAIAHSAYALLHFADIIVKTRNVNADALTLNQLKTHRELLNQASDILLNYHIQAPEATREQAKRTVNEIVNACNQLKKETNDLITALPMHRDATTFATCENIKRHAAAILTRFDKLTDLMQGKPAKLARKLPTAEGARNIFGKVWAWLRPRERAPAQQPSEELRPVLEQPRVEPEQVRPVQREPVAEITRELPRPLVRNVSQIPAVSQAITTALEQAAGFAAGKDIEVETLKTRLLQLLSDITQSRTLTVEEVEKYPQHSMWKALIRQRDAIILLIEKLIQDINSTLNMLEKQTLTEQDKSAIGRAVSDAETVNQSVRAQINALQKLLSLGRRRVLREAPEETKEGAEELEKQETIKQKAEPEEIEPIVEEKVKVPVDLKEFFQNAHDIQQKIMSNIIDIYQDRNLLGRILAGTDQPKYNLLKKQKEKLNNLPIKDAANKAKELKNQELQDGVLAVEELAKQVDKFFETIETLKITPPPERKKIIEKERRQIYPIYRIGSTINSAKKAA